MARQGTDVGPVTHSAYKTAAPDFNKGYSVRDGDIASRLCKPALPASRVTAEWLYRLVARLVRERIVDPLA